MTSVLEKRLDAFEDSLSQLARKFKAVRKLNQEKEIVAEELVGMPYYFGDYSGTYEGCTTDKTKVVANIVNQITGLQCFWVFDAFDALAHLDTIAQFSSWEEYRADSLLRWAMEMENLLIQSNFSVEEVYEKMVGYCKKFKIGYKTYYRVGNI